jgi:GTPase SAR1 family protein
VTGKNKSKDECPSKVNYRLKIRMVGEEGAGKSSLILHATDNTYPDCSTVIGDFMPITVDFEEFKMLLQLWNTVSVGKDKSDFYRPFHAVAVVFDLSERDSWEAVPNWLRDMKSYACTNTALVLVGTKKDLPRVVPRDEIQTFVDCEQRLYFETSAQTSEGVEYFINRLALKMIDVNEDVSPEDVPKFLATAWMTKRRGQDHFSVFLLLRSEKRKSPKKPSLCGDQNRYFQTLPFV